jgi:outer membrane protein OmpA-like peptidoglycan-associated protein
VKLRETRAGLLALLAGAALAACAPRANLIVVLPEDDGHVGAVVVQDPQGSAAAVLDQPYAAVGSGAGSSDVRPVSIDSKELNQVFGSALAARPIAPREFTLYYETGTTALTPESEITFGRVFDDIARRQAAEVVATGHTDTVGDLLDNDALSLDRARAVAALLIARGVPAEDVVVAGRGERELRVRTADNTDEPRNRRVVVTVR